MPDGKIVLVEELAGRAETARLFLCRGRRHSACAEEHVGLIAFKGILLVARACPAVLPADLPVLFRILHNGRVAFHHNEWIVR